MDTGVNFVKVTSFLYSHSVVVYVRQYILAVYFHISTFIVYDGK